LRGKAAGPGHDRTCPVVNILKATQQGGSTGTAQMPVVVY